MNGTHEHPLIDLMIFAIVVRFELRLAGLDPDVCLGSAPTASTPWS